MLAFKSLLLLELMINLSLPDGTFHSDRNLSYACDGLVTSNYFRGVDDPIFIRALNLTKRKVSHSLYHRWRLHFAVTLIFQIIHSCMNRGCQFVYVECGVGEGHTLLTALNYFTLLLETNHYNCAEHFLNGKFLIIDTFEGVDKSLIQPGDNIRYITSTYHGANLHVIKNRFAMIKDLAIIPKSIPSALVDIHHPFQDPSFLHVDMNHDVPEKHALAYFLPRISNGFVLLDDYGFNAHSRQRLAIDSLCASLQFPLPLNIPTGQGLLFKNY